MEPPQPDPNPLDAGYREAVVDLLGVLAYAELSGFFRLTADAEKAPTQPTTTALARMAVTEFGHHEALVARLQEMGADPAEAMAPFAKHIDAFHERTRPGDWLEGLVKAYVGDGIATDFYREVTAYVDASTRELVQAVLENAGQAEFIVSTVREAIEAQPQLAGRLALWARRLVGEAISQAQFVVVERDGLATLLVGGHEGTGADLAELGRMFARLTDEHTHRMERLGLSA